jgi:U3 small nucleolar RNA-associated protein 12
VAINEEESQQEAGYQPNVLLLGLTPGQYVLRAVRAVRSNDLEAALMVLAFPDALKVLSYVPGWLEDTSAVRSARCVQLHSV